MLHPHLWFNTSRSLQFSSLALETSFPAVDEPAPLVYKQVHQEQIPAEPGSFERAQQRIVENIVHVPIPQIQEQFVERVQEIPQECLPERIEEPNKITAIPHSISCSAPAPVIKDISPEPGVPCATTVPAIKHVAPTPLIEHVEPAPELQLGEIGFDMFGKSCEVIRNDTGPHFIGQIRVLYPWEKRGRFESGSWMRRSDFTANSHDAECRRLFSRGGMTDFYESDGICMLQYVIHMSTLCS